MHTTLLTLRGAQAVAGTVVMILTSFVTDWWRTVHHTRPPVEITFLVATAVLTIVFSFYNLLVLTVPQAKKWSHHVATMTVDALLGVMWFGGFVALPVFLKQRVCFGGVCRMAYTSVCFGAGEWALCVAGVVITGVVAVRESKAKNAARDLAGNEKDLEGASIETESIDIVFKN